MIPQVKRRNLNAQATVSYLTVVLQKQIQKNLPLFKKAKQRREYASAVISSFGKLRVVMAPKLAQQKLFHFKRY